MLLTGHQLRYTKVGDERRLTLDRGGELLSDFEVYPGIENRIYGYEVARHVMNISIAVAILRLLFILSALIAFFVIGSRAWYKMVLALPVVAFVLYELYSIIDQRVEDADGNCINLAMNIVIVGNLPVRLMK